MIQFINHDPSVTNYLISGKCYNPNERCYFRGTEAQVSQNLSQDLIYAANFKQLRNHFCYFGKQQILFQSSVSRHNSASVP